MDSLELCMGCMGRRGTSEVCPLCGYKEGTPPDSPLHIPPRSELHNQYLIGRVLGHGGFGITYLGWDKNLERKLAVKEYFPSGVAMRTGPNMEVAPYSGQHQKDYEYGLERYLEEARMIARFNNHPNILSVLNFFRENGTAYIVMEYLEGVTLEKHVDRMGGRIGFDEALMLLLPVMDALEEVHESGILHRDVSPDNIHLGPNRQVKLLDFGAARVALGERSRNLSVILKEGFAPSEQYRTKGMQGPWTDIYALAATMYRCTTGEMPPPALDRMTEDELKPPRALGVEMDEAQEKTLLRALAFDPRDRMQSMSEFREAMSPRTAVPGSPTYQQITTAASVRRPSAAYAVTRVATAQPPETAVPAPVGEPISAPPSKISVPAWVWSVAAGAIVIAVLFAVRPGSDPPQSQPVIPASQPHTAKALPLAPDVPPPKPQETAEAKPEPAPPPTEPPKPSPPTYDELFTAARQVEAPDPAHSLELLEQAVKLNPARPETYDLIAQIQLYRSGNVEQASSNYKKALEQGGVATFRVLDDRKESSGPGQLKIGKDSLSYTGADGTGAVTIRTSEMKEFRRNRGLVAKFRRSQGQGSFHLKLANGETYNFLGSSGQKIAERDLILQLAGER